MRSYLSGNGSDLSLFLEWLQAKSQLHDSTTETNKQRMKGSRPMYTFKHNDAEVAIRVYFQDHPASQVAVRALNGDCAAMMELYEELCGPSEQVFDEGPSDNATSIISEAVACKYAPAMVRLAQDTMGLGDGIYWADGLMMLMEAYTLGSQEALTVLRNAWHNVGKDADRRRKSGAELDQYDEFTVAFFYYHGIGVSKDEPLALRLFRAAAKHGCDEANKMLKKIRPDEQEIPPDKTEDKMIEKPCGSTECAFFVEQCGGNPESPSECICRGCGAEGPMRRFFDQLQDDENAD